MAEQEEANLRATLKALVPKILEHRNRQIAEEETKQWLIAPLLAALGWDAQDPAEVRYEYRANRQCNPVDYGLMVQGKTKLVIEAKGLGRDLDTGIAQLFGNLGVAGGVHWGVLTDGDQYRVVTKVILGFARIGAMMDPPAFSEDEADEWTEQCQIADTHGFACSFAHYPKAKPARLN